MHLSVNLQLLDFLCVLVPLSPESTQWGHTDNLNLNI